MTARPLFHRRIVLVTAAFVAVLLCLLVGPVPVSRATTTTASAASTASTPSAGTGISSVVARDAAITVSDSAAAGSSVTVGR